MLSAATATAAATVVVTLVLLARASTWMVMNSPF
jgi:hypothetical protein